MSTETPETPVKKRRSPRSKGMEQDELHKRYPTLKTLTQPRSSSVESAWVATFNARPDAMHALLADYIKQVHARPGRIGQRPMPKEEEVDFKSLIYGENNEKPLTEIVPVLQAQLPPHLRSERNFCDTMAMTRATYRRILSGEIHPDANEIRMIAKALGKPAVFFPEYRQIMILAALTNLLTEEPGIASALYRDYLNIRMDR